MFGSDPRIYTTTVKEFIGDKAGNLKKAVCCKLESKKDEKTGRMMMVPIEGSEFTLDVDVVLIAAGFLGSQDYVTKAFGVEVNARTNVNTAPGQYKTNVDRVFTAGDMHRGQSLVVWGHPRGPGGRLRGGSGSDGVYEPAGAVNKHREKEKRRKLLFLLLYRKYRVT